MRSQRVAADDERAAPHDIATATSRHALHLDPDGRCHCGALVAEDLAFAADVRHFAPGAPIRQWRCQAGHTYTMNDVPRWASVQRRDVRTFTVRCDICGSTFTSPRQFARRHPACHDEHERRYRLARWHERRQVRPLEARA